MNPKAIYDEIIRGIDEHEKRSIARKLSYQIGEDDPISLELLAASIYGDATESNMRRAREVMERLIEEDGIAVCSHSGKAGRWLAKWREEGEAAASEREARAKKLLLSARKLREASKNLPAKDPNADTALQVSLF